MLLYYYFSFDFGVALLLTLMDLGDPREMTQLFHWSSLPGVNALTSLRPPENLRAYMLPRTSGRRALCVCASWLCARSKTCGHKFMFT